MFWRYPCMAAVSVSLLLLTLLSYKSVHAARLPGGDTTSPQPTDTTHFVVYDYATASFNNQFLPIDRSFNIKIINIPPDSTVNSVSILEFEGRYRRRKYKFRNGELITPRELDSLLVYREIICKPGGSTRTGDKIFMVPKHLIPNREYVVSIGNGTSQPLSEKEKESFIPKMTNILQKDDYFKNLFSKSLTKYFNNPRSSYDPVKLTQDSIAKHLQRLVSDSFPGYKFYPGKDSLIDQELALRLDAVRNLRHHLDDLRARNCITDSAQKKMLADVSDQFGDKNMDWFGLSDSKIKQRFDNQLDVVSVQGECKTLKDMAKDRIDSISLYLSNEVELSAAKIMSEKIFNLGTIEATYFVDILKNAQRNVTIDLGAGYSWSMDRPFIYTAVNVYFRPIDKNLPLRNTNYSFWDYFGSHLSLLVGMTLTPVNKDGVRDGILGNKGLILGGGFRLLPWLKISNGYLIYYGLNKNPLNSSRTTRFTPFASLSIDVDVKSIFKSFPVIDETLFK